MLSIFPEVPYDYVCAAAGNDADPECLSAEGAPWNRRKRRSIARAKRGEVLLHLFAGSQRWRCPGRVVEVEKSRGSDLMSPGVFQHVLCWGIKGVIGGVVGGPPCRSVSCCRSATDGGPPPVRDRYGSRWGLADLPEHWKQMVKSDSVLWLRFLLAYAVAQASSDVAVLIPDSNQSGGDQVEVASCNQQQVQTLPQGVDDPVELARWALPEAVKRLHGRRESGYYLPKESVKPVFFVWEHPADPETYLSKTFEPEGGWPSWWAFDEWRCFANTYGLHLARLDQGRYGHIRPKPTGLATSSWFLYERLHGQVLSEAEAKAFGRGPRSVEHRIAEVPGWASWAPGLTRCVLEAWILWGQEQGLWSEVQDRRAYVVKLTEQEMQRRHENQDHVPFRKGCPVCIGAQGRQRSHWRASVKAVYSASFDIAGPFKPGRSFDATVSGRDKGGGYKYFLACAFMVPLVRASGTPVESFTGKVEPVAPNLDLPDMAELFPEGVDGALELEPAPEAMGKAVRFRIREKRSEDLDSLSSGVVEVPEEAPPLPPPAGEPPKDGAIAVATRLLCMGTPLRSKKGREVCGAVQAIINQLEAFGFPVHRYHADRAQELKSKQLLAWLRDKGIHTTWTPGDTPAGNRAEVAVQQLKSQSRKLLHAAQLGVEFWPLALLHASTRHWSVLAHDLGIVQPVLLPFGLRLQARKRQKTGYGSHWTTRTVPGQYVGRAPNTPGGHLVLVEQDSGDKKVLLTNTVYPVRDSRSGKPRFRVKGKTSPEFLLRPVYAWHFPSLAEGPPPPRGEWDGGDASAVVYEFWPVGEYGCVNARSEGQQNCEESNAPTGQQVLRENSAPKWQQVLEQDGAPVRLRTLEVAKSEGQQTREESNAPTWQQVLRENSAPKGQQVLEQDGAPARLRTLREVDDRTLGDESLDDRGVDLEACWDVVRVSLGEKERDGLSASLEVYQVKKSWGHQKLPQPKENWDYPSAEAKLVRYLNRVVANWSEGFQWTTLDLYRSEFFEGMAIAEPMELDSWFVALGEFTGGGLWVEDGSGKGPVVVVDQRGTARAGNIENVHNSPVRICGGLGYGLMPWFGKELWVLQAWTPRGTISLPEDYRVLLGELGFRPPCGQAQGLERGSRPEPTLRAAISNLQMLEELENPEVKRTAFSESTQEENTLEEVEQWEVDVPFELVDGLWVEGALALSEAAAYACTTSVRQICRSRAEPEIGMNLEGFNRAVRERAWIEEVLVQLQDSAESSAKVRSLAAEASLGDSVPTAPEQFLQTRTVSLDEARRELDLWYDAGKEEVEALEVTTRAVERVDSSLVDEWILEGKRVVQVPGKAVLTRKSGVGKRRLRAVCCGNHLPASATGDKADLYAGGVDALTVRVVLGYSAQFLDWTVCVLDIKTAFLNAPARSSSEGDENGPIIVVKPPYLLVQLGLMEVGQRWRVRRALYGLQTSPRDWAVYRDAEMRAMVVQTEEPSTLTQSQTDDSMWLVRTKKGNVLGLIVVYVDDIAVFGAKEVTQKVAEAFMAKWKTSTPLWPSPTEPVSFCGMEVAPLSDGWRITQSKYLKEVLRRYEVDGVASCPMPRWEEPELEQASLGQVREAQAITGAVLWAVTRTRPDLMFVAARMSQYSTKSPVAVKAWGMHALRYVASTLTLGLEYKESPGPMLGEFQQLSLPRSNDTLELYSDASHAPGGGKSMQTTVAVWRGGLVAWEATRQPFVTLSSAEAELVSMVHSLQMSDSIVPVIEELVQVDLRTALMADSAAALASFAPSSGSWRNRHLRLRAAAARERVEWGTLNAAYIPGELQVADIGTKPLSGQRILGLLRLVGVRTAEEEDVSSLAAKTSRFHRKPDSPIRGSVGSCSPGMLA